MTAGEKMIIVFFIVLVLALIYGTIILPTQSFDDLREKLKVFCSEAGYEEIGAMSMFDSDSYCWKIVNDTYIEKPVIHKKGVWYWYD